MADVERERVTALWREAAAALVPAATTIRAGNVEPHRYQYGGFEVQGDCAVCGHVADSPIHSHERRADAAEAECGRLREQLDALREAFRTYVDATTFKSSLPDDVGSPNAPTRNAWAVARAALGVEGEPAADPCVQAGRHVCGPLGVEGEQE